MDDNIQERRLGTDAVRTKRDLRIGIIGGGAGGLCMGIKLKEAGFENFTIFEKSRGVGGTWYNNVYPGLACDVPSHLYSLSCEPNPAWSRAFAPQPEILTYLQQVADKYGIMPHVRLSTAVKAARWDDEPRKWRLTLANGNIETFDVVISALGMFTNLNWPDIQGLRDFQGAHFHSGQWDKAHDLTGESVAVIGAAASAVQFVPKIADQVKALYVYQRTPPWILPKDDPIFDEPTIKARLSDPTETRELRAKIFQELERLTSYGNMENVAACEKICREFLETQIRDPDLRRKLTPAYPWGCTRPLISNDYYPVFDTGRAELITDGITEITQDGVISGDGRVRKVDTIICATGYQVQKFLSIIDVTGRDGISIQEAWKNGAEAYLGITTTGFPNLFMIYGPNTNNGSILYMVECQVAYIIRYITAIVEKDISYLDVRPEVQKTYNETLQRDIAKVTVWAACNSYYSNDAGRIVTQCPYTMTDYRAMTMKPDEDAFTYEYGRSLPR
jgi:cation diffusion facilitator CzcD-associated flavoprotein CzcO